MSALPKPDDYDIAPATADGHFPAFVTHRRTLYTDREILWAIWDKMLEIEQRLATLEPRNP